MKTLRDLVLGTGGLNENGFVRALRICALALAIVMLEAVASFVTGGGLDELIKTVHYGSFTLQPATVDVGLTAAIVGAEKWLRNRKPQAYVLGPVSGVGPQPLPPPGAAGAVPRDPSQ